MRIIVFDDDPRDLARLLEMIDKWERLRRHSDIIIKTYDSICAMEFDFSDILFYDLFFMDIMTPDSANAGFSLAERIHSDNPNSNIVFTTNSSEYWGNAFEISALRYLIKPLEQDKLFNLLDYVYDNPSKIHTHAAVLPGIKSEVIVPYDRILYIEARTDNHLAQVNLTNGDIVEIKLTSTPFSAIPDKYLTKDFAQCHRSIIVNLNYVTGYDMHYITVKGVPLSMEIGKAYRSSFVSRIIEHYKELRTL